MQKDRESVVDSAHSASTVNGNDALPGQSDNLLDEHHHSPPYDAVREGGVTLSTANDKEALPIQQQMTLPGSEAPPANEPETIPSSALAMEQSSLQQQEEGEEGEDVEEENKDELPEKLSNVDHEQDKTLPSEPLISPSTTATTAITTEEIPLEIASTHTQTTPSLYSLIPSSQAQLPISLPLPTPTQVSSHHHHPSSEPLPPISSLKVGASSQLPPGMKAGNGAVRSNIIQLPGSVVGKPTPPPSTVHGGPTLHAPAPRLVSPTYHGPPGYSIMTAPPSYQGHSAPPPPPPPHHHTSHLSSGPVSNGPTGPTILSSSTSSAATHPHLSQQQQKMELQDAFAYLDRVKAEFSDQPDVYNRFLQIMREFKANAIDANGVIVRVVQLFKGHKALIQGFNAFLPRTHHIDPMVAETGILPPHLMQVAASMGIPVSSQGIPLSGPYGPGSIGAPGRPPPPPPTMYGHPPGVQPWPPIPPTDAGPYQWGGRPPPPPPPAPPQSISHAPSSINTAAVVPTQPPSTTAVSSASLGGPVTGPSTPSKKSSAQFVRAISYVKKIKHRFATDPEVYKTFLAALHSYHKEQRTIFEVYMEVASLFANHPDLLEEFVLFLPENEAAAITQRLMASGMGPAGAITSTTTGSTKSTTQAAVAVAAASAALNNRVTSSGSLRLKRAATAVSTGTTGAAPTLTSASAAVPIGKTGKRARQAASLASRSAEESAFYERVKRYLGDKNAYAEFLKCLNLFCQDIIKIGDLVQLVSRFIGNNDELFGWFKQYIGYKDGGPEINLICPLDEPKRDSHLINEQGELNLAACKKVGSYRIYPKSHILPKSSYRTSLGKEVLNDTMVSCPVFNSEDSTFIASKKNQYEEALFRCEDERFEMDLLIDYNLATISVFEPLAKKLEAMTLEERNSFTLGPYLGGTSTVIYKKAIRRIYGEKADEVIAGLMKNPAAALPVVLRRLKQKDEEWRRVQRDWNKIWRDVHLKNYYKALDHQGIEFKANDRKNVTGRNLVMEIENIAAERKRALEKGDRLDSTASHHLEFTIADPRNLAQDILHIIRSYLKGGLVSFSKNDSKSIIKFLTSFLSNFLTLSPFKDNSTQLEVPDKHTLKREINSGESEHSSADDSMSDGETQFNVALPPDGEKFGNDTKGPVLLFANANLYILVRLLQMAMGRLEQLYQVAKQSAGSPFLSEKKNIVATFLDLQEKHDLGLDSSQNGSFYETLVAMLKQLVAGDLDGNVFEERARFMFGTEAYPIFTFDKLVQTLVKQVQIILADATCEQLIRLFDSWNSRRNAMRLSEYSARMAVDNVLPSKEPIYRIEFQGKTGRLTIQQLDRFSITDVGGIGSMGLSAEAKWSAYVDDFVKLEGNSQYLSKAKVYLNRCRLPSDSASPDHLLVQYNLECKIAINTYKLFYVENTEDFLFRFKVLHRGRCDLKLCTKRWKTWLNAINGN